MRNAIAGVLLAVVAGSGATMVSAARGMPSSPSFTVPKQLLGTFEPISNTAMGMLGEADVSQNAITFNGRRVPFASAKSMSADEAASVNSFHVVSSTPKQSFLARVNIPGSQIFLGKDPRNTLCGGKPVTYIAAVADGSTSIGLVLFTGTSEPVLTAASLGSSHSVCASFSYQRKQ